MDRSPPSDINGDPSRNERGPIDNISRALRRADKATRAVDRYTKKQEKYEYLKILRQAIEQLRPRIRRHGLASGT